MRECVYDFVYSDAKNKNIFSIADRASHDQLSKIGIPQEDYLENPETYLSDSQELQLAIQHPERSDNRQVDEVCRKRGIDPFYFRAAASWAREKTPPIDQNEVALDQYNLIEYLSKKGLAEIDCLSVLHKCAKADKNLTTGTTAKYSVMPVFSELFGESNKGAILGGWYPKIIGENKKIEIYMDRPVGFTLNHNHIPIAITTYGISAPGELMIYQIQGIKPKPIDKKLAATKQKKYYSTWGLEPFNWRAFMVEVSAELARTVGLHNLAIQSAANNEWVKKSNNNTAAGFSFEKARAGYDLPAQQLGFKLGHDNNWRRSVK